MSVFREVYLVVGFSTDGYLVLFWNYVTVADVRSLNNFQSHEEFIGDVDLELISSHLQNDSLSNLAITLSILIFSVILRKVPVLLPQSLIKY